MLLPILGNFRPDKFSFLPSMRYYAGNWATTRGYSAREAGRRRSSIPRSRSRRRILAEQVGDIYDPETAEYLLNRGLAFRAMHSHGRALNALLPHAVDDVEAYDVREGELISNVVNGWNFGDAHFHGAQLLEAIQERCGFADGRRAGDHTRVRADGATPAASSATQSTTPASGLLEEGFVRVEDMVDAASRGSTSPSTFPSRSDGRPARRPGAVPTGSTPAP